MHMHVRIVYYLCKSCCPELSCCNTGCLLCKQIIQLVYHITQLIHCIHQCLDGKFLQMVKHPIQTQMQKYITSQGKKKHVGVSSLPAQTKMSNANGLVKQVASQSQRKNIRKQPKKHKEFVLQDTLTRLSDPFQDTKIHNTRLLNKTAAADSEAPACKRERKKVNDPSGAHLQLL